MKRNLYLTDDEIKNVEHRVISYGAGTQSTAMLLMGLTDKLHARPEYAVFADTGGEPNEVYDYLELIKGYVKTEFDFDIYTVEKKGNNIVEDISNPRRSAKGNYYIDNAPPLFVKRDNNGLIYMINRNCTTKYKVNPFHGFVKKKCGIRQNNDIQAKSIEIWMGISYDEMQRMKISTDWYAIYRYPLVEIEYKRNDSIKMVMNHGLPEPPRSACTFCPYHSNHEWRHLKEKYPDEFDKVVELEKKMQKGVNKKSAFKGLPYFHKSCVPIGDIDFNDNQVDLFGDGFINECEGVCGI